MGTEAGVGVRNAGNIGASAGELTLTQDGQLINTGRITSSGNANVTVTGDIGNTGTIYAQANANLATQGSIANSSVIASLVNLALTANDIVSTTGSVMAAGLKSDGTLTTTGALTATASRNLVAHGKILAGGDQSLAAASLDVSGSTTVGHHLTLISDTGSLDAANATISATGLLSASTPGTLTTDNASITASQINWAAQDLSNVQGTMMQAGADDMHITLHGNLDNTGGSLESMGNIGIDLGAGTLTNAGGLVISNKQLNLNAGSIDNHNTDGSRQGIQGDRVVIEADTVNNRHGTILASTTLGITGSGTLDNTQGTISSIGSLDITDRQATSTGNAADKTLDITNTGGTLVAGTAMNVDSRSLTGDGKVISQGDLTSKLLQNYTNTGAWQAGGNG
ncbi:conserved hypothetical protein, partial [Ricinus communis]